MCIGIFSFRAFDRRLARLAAPISSGVRQGGRICPPPPSGARSAEYPSGARVNPETQRQQHCELNAGIVIGRLVTSCSSAVSRVTDYLSTALVQSSVKSFPGNTLYVYALLDTLTLSAPS